MSYQEENNQMMVQQPSFIPHKEKIMQIPGILVKQKLDLLEVICDCKKLNKYYVYEKQPGKIKRANKKRLYKCKEKSGYYSRNCLLDACSTFKIIVENLGSKDKDDRECVVIENECTCTCLCFNEYREIPKNYYKLIRSMIYSTLNSSGLTKV